MSHYLPHLFENEEAGKSALAAIQRNNKFDRFSFDPEELLKVLLDATRFYFAADDHRKIESKRRSHREVKQISDAAERFKKTLTPSVFFDPDHMKFVRNLIKDLDELQIICRRWLDRRESALGEKTITPPRPGPIERIDVEMTIPSLVSYWERATKEKFPASFRTAKGKTKTALGHEEQREFVGLGPEFIRLVLSEFEKVLIAKKIPDQVFDTNAFRSGVRTKLEKYLRERENKRAGKKQMAIEKAL